MREVRRHRSLRWRRARRSSSGHHADPPGCVSRAGVYWSPDAASAVRRRAERARMTRKRAARRCPSLRSLEVPRSSETVDPGSRHDVPHVTHASSPDAVPVPCVASSEVGAAHALGRRAARGCGHGCRGLREDVPVLHERSGLLRLVPSRLAYAPARQFSRVAPVQQLSYRNVQIERGPVPSDEVQRRQGVRTARGARPFAL